MSIAIGGLLLPTEEAMAGPLLAAEMAERGFESLWVVDHPPIPVEAEGAEVGDGLGEPDHPNASGESDQRALDPFVYLAAAAVAEVEIGLGVGICLETQRDPVQTARLVASIDQISGGRLLFGVGAGWQEEGRRGGVADPDRPAKRARENLEAMQLIWTNDTAEYHGEFVDFGPMQAWPKPFQDPYPPVLVGGTSPDTAERAAWWGDGWYLRSDLPRLVDSVVAYRQMARGAGKEPSVNVLIADPTHLSIVEALAPDRIIVGIPPFDSSGMRVALDGYLDLIERNR